MKTCLRWHHTSSLRFGIEPKIVPMESRASADSSGHSGLTPTVDWAGACTLTITEGSGAASPRRRRPISRFQKTLGAAAHRVCQGRAAVRQRECAFPSLYVATCSTRLALDWGPIAGIRFRVSWGHKHVQRVGSWTAKSASTAEYRLVGEAQMATASGSGIHFTEKSRATTREADTSGSSTSTLGN